METPAIPPTPGDLLTLRDLARRLPCRRQGRPVAYSTIWRWCSRGVHGIRLRCWRSGGAPVTTWAEYLAWMAAVSARDPLCAPAPAVAAPPPAPDARQAAAAEDTLRAAGILPSSDAVQAKLDRPRDTMRRTRRGGRRG